MKLFNTMTARQYKAAVKRYTGEGAGADYKTYCDFLANTFRIYAESQDVTHLNRILDAGRFRGMYRDLKRITDTFSAYPFAQKQGGYYGTADKSKLALMHNVDDDGVAVWEKALYDALAKVAEKQTAQEQADTTPMTPEQAENKIANLIKALASAGYNMEDIQALMHNGMEAYLDACEEYETKQAA